MGYGKGELRFFGQFCSSHLKYYSRTRNSYKYSYQHQLYYNVISFNETCKHFLVLCSYWYVLILLPKSFRWIEFAKKSVAKRVANLLNGEQIGVFSFPFYFSVLLLVGSCLVVEPWEIIHPPNPFTLCPLILFVGRYLFEEVLDV